MGVVETTRRSPAASAALLLLLSFATSSPRAARGDAASLAWGACAGGGGVSNQTFACDTNIGDHVIIGSFVLGESLPFTADWGVEARLTAGQPGTSSTVPEWWRLEPGGCRAGVLSTSFDFTSNPYVPCADPYFGQALAAPPQITLITTPDLPPHGSSTFERIQLGAYVPLPVTLAAGTEYDAFRIRITNAGTRGSTACAGCCQEMAIVLDDLVISGGTTVVHFVNQPVVSWQSFGSPCQATPERAASWGRVRSLYR